MMVQKKKKTEYNKRKWISLLLTGAMALLVLGQAVAAQETGEQKSSYIQKGGLRKVVNKGLNLEKENESMPGGNSSQEHEQPPGQEQPQEETVPSGEEPGDTAPSEEKPDDMTEKPEAVLPQGEAAQGDDDEASEEKENVRSLRTASSRGEQVIYQRHYRVSHVQDAGMDLLWDSAMKRLRGKSWYGTVVNVRYRQIYVGLAREDDKHSSVKKTYPPYTQSFWKLYADGMISVYDYGKEVGGLGGTANTFQAYTGSLLYVSVPFGNYYWDGARRYDDRMGIVYKQQGTDSSQENQQYFKILADGTMRQEVGPNFLSSETRLPYLNATLKVHENHMAVLGDDFLSSGRNNEKIKMRLKDRNGYIRFERITQEGESYYDTFKDIQGLQFTDGDTLELTDYFSQRLSEYTYNSARKEFLLNKNNEPSATHLIQLNGSAGERVGYDFAIEDGTIKYTRARGKGSILHESWGGKVYLSVGIFKANGDLKEKATMFGGNHTVFDTDIGYMKGLRLEDGDEIVLYGVKDGRWDESSKIRVLGKVNGAMNGLDGFERKPEFNTKVFRYSSSTKDFSQVDGTIPEMEEALKSTVEERLKKMSLAPESNGNKKAWLLGLHSDETISFSKKNIQKLTGLEYAVNMRKVSVSDNPVRPETYQSLRNLRSLREVDIGGIGLGGHEKAMVDILVGLGPLSVVRAGNNGIKNVEEFGRLRQILELYLENNNIRDVRPLKDWASTGGARTIVVENQTIMEPAVRIRQRERFQAENNICGVLDAPVRNISDFQPGRGDYDALTNTVTWWSGLDLGRTELSYAFSVSQNVAYSNVSYSGRVKRAADIIEDVLVIFDPDGGNVTEKSRWLLDKGAVAGDLLKPETLGLSHPRGYRFAGWYENDGGTGKAWKEDTPINKDMTLYAKWEPAAGEYVIRLNGANISGVIGGYDLVLKDGIITEVLLRREGEKLQEDWKGRVYLSIGIFKSNGDVKKKATMLGGDHRVSNTSEVANLKETVLEDGDEIVIYAVKDEYEDESTKVRVIGDVEGAMPGLPSSGEKPGWNNQILRYSSATKKLSQVDGRIAGMDRALKSTVEEKLKKLSLLPGENGDKKAWQLGLYSDVQISFSNKNIQKLTGLEYALNMTKVSVSDNPVKPETYCALRNLIQVNDLNIGGIKLGGRVKNMVDVLMKLPKLKRIYAGHNGITNVGEFGRLHQLTSLDVENNSISDISPLQGLSTAGLKELSATNQNITQPKVEVGSTESYLFTNPLKMLTGAPVQRLTNITPTGKGNFSAQNNQVTWSNLEMSTTELGYDFEDRGTLAGMETQYRFSGQVKIPVEIKLVVKFNPNGGEWTTDGSTGNKQLYLSRGEAVGPMMDGTKFSLRHSLGYRFAGWYETPEGTGETWDMDAPVNQDMTLYACWKYNNEAVYLVEIPKRVDLKSIGTGEATGTGTVKVADSLQTNLLYENILVKATPKIRLTNPKTEEAYDVTVWKEDESAYTDGSQPLMRLHPKGAGLPKEESFTLKTTNLYPKKAGKYEGNMIFNFSWE